MKVIWGDRSFYVSNYWLENLKIIVNGVMTKQTSAVLIFDGRSGLGKTTLSSQTSCVIHNLVKQYMGDKTPEFNLDCMAWTPDDFVEKLEKAHKGDTVILDESMILSNRSTMADMNKKVIIMMSLIRSKQIFVIFNINSIFDMDRNLPLHRADVLVHLYADNDKFAARGRYMVIPSAKGKLKMLYVLGKKYYDYSKAKPAFRDKFTAFFPFDNKEYESKKQEAIRDYFGNSRQTQSKIKDSRDKGICYFKREYKLTHEELATAFDVSVKTVYRALKLHNAD